MATDVLAFQRQSLENWYLDTPHVRMTRGGEGSTSLHKCYLQPRFNIAYLLSQLCYILVVIMQRGSHNIMLRDQSPAHKAWRRRTTTTTLWALEKFGI